MIQKIVVVLNHLENADMLLRRAIRLAQEQNALLELFFVYEAPFFTLPDYFLHLGHKESELVDKEKIKEELAQKIRSLGYEESCAIFVFIDDTADRIAVHTEEESGTLIIAAYHKSISEALVKKCYPPLLILKKDHETPRQISLLAELDENTKNCIQTTKSLFPKSSIRLIYDNHYLADKEENEAQKEVFARIKAETGLEGDYIEEFAWNEADFGEDFDAMEKHLLDQIEKNGTDLTLLCASEGKYLYSEGVSLSLLHKVSGDVLIFSCDPL
jgi:hypothetical protein